MDSQAFPVPILRTKLHPRPVTPDLLCRARLHEILDGALAMPLTLVSAPAGYGKSTLVGHWLEGRAESSAWVSLDESDSDWVEFTSYFLCALREIVPEACPETLALLNSVGTTTFAIVATSLANELDAIEAPLVLVLDDFHRISSDSEVHELLSSLMEHPPRALHLILATRRDPPLALGSLRARSLLTEVRMQDLRFTTPEAAALLETKAGLSVSPAALARLNQETEGWVGGLCLAILAARGAEAAGSFFENLHGGVQATQDYLIQEVVRQQGPEIRKWILKSSVLDRFAPALCQAVCGPPESSSAAGIDGEVFVRALKEGNLFCVSLDREGDWFRYHHLFRDLLQVELAREYSPQEIVDLHARAMLWFGEQGLIGEAIDHALAAGDTRGAVWLVEKNRMRVLDEDRWYILEKWMNRLPDRGAKERPALLLARAWSLFFKLNFEAVPALLDEIEGKLGEDPGDEALWGEVDFFRGFFNLFAGNASESVEYLQQAMEKIPVDHHELHGEAEVHLALALQMDGRLESARRDLEGLLVDVDSLHPIRQTRVLAALAYLHIISGDLAAARPVVEMLGLVARDQDYLYAGAWSVYLLGMIHFYRGELEDAESFLGRAVEQRFNLHRRAVADALVALALVREAQARREEADSALELLVGFSRLHTDPDLLAIAESCRRRLSLLRSDTEADTHLSPECPAEAMLFWIEVPAITHCRSPVAGSSPAGLKKAERGLRECLELNRGHYNIQQEITILPLLALAQERQGRREEALESLERALRLAAPGGWVQPFVEPGPEVAGLLRRLLPLGIGEAELIGRILATFERGREAASATQEPVRAAPIRPNGDGDDPDALTNRQLDILELLAKRLQNKEIAAELCISSHTVNDHLKHVYQKLRVSNRRQAVAKALELGILRAS